MNALHHHLKNVSEAFAMNQLFSKPPTLRFSSQQKTCCRQTLNVLKTQEKEASTLTIGRFHAHEIIYQCKQCHSKYYSESLRNLVPHRCQFGFDIIIYVGTALYVENRNHIEIQQSLKEKNISISLREITFVGNKYITYLSIAHNEAKDKIKLQLDYQGGYVLHLDGTCEGDSPHLFSSMDELSGIVLHNVKMPTENKKYIIPFLEEIKASYGDPIAIVSDMSSSILDAVRQVFPEVKHFICHFHFLRDIGKDLFQLEYRNISRFLRAFKTRSILRKSIRELKSFINEDEVLKQSLIGYLSQDDLGELDNALPSIVSAYILLTWVIEAKTISSGYGFPFDRPHVDFVRRLQQAYPVLKELNVSLKRESGIKLPIKSIYNVLSDTALNNNLQRISEKIITFDELRAAMRIAKIDKTNGLNDEGDNDIKTIQLAVETFRNSGKVKQLEVQYFSCKKFVKQIDKYWGMLFADPIEVKTSDGKTKSIFPQRTNNSMEHLFRSDKSNDRKKSGTKSVRKQMKSMHPQRPLIRNLCNSEYHDIILNGKANLAERFADIDAKLVQEEMKKEREVAMKYHKGMIKVFKLSQLPEKLFNKSSKSSLAV